MDHGFISAGYSYELIILTSSSETERKKKEISIGGEKYSKEKILKMWAQKRSVTEIGILGQEEKICIRNKQNFILFPYKDF